MLLDDPQAPYLPSDHNWPDANAPRYVVLHGTGYDPQQTAAGVAHDFQTTNPNSVHYAVDRSGGVVQIVPEGWAAWGNGVVSAGADPWWIDNPNNYTISIETVNDSSNSLGLTSAQASSLFGLVYRICRRWGISPRPADSTGGIAGHYQIDPVNRSRCPGPNFPWTALWADLVGRDWSMGTWIAPGAIALSEFARESDGTYLHATCVEAAALMCAISEHPAFALPAAQYGDKLRQMVRLWQTYGTGVSDQGASSYVDATRWLRALGFRVDENVFGVNWWNELQAGLFYDHAVFLIGVTNAQGLHGDEPGVQNHGLCAFGLDADGNIICGDPDNAASQVNMPGSPVGKFVTYSRADFVAGAISSLTKVYPMAGVPQGWTDDGTTLTAPPVSMNGTGHSVKQGFRTFVMNNPWDPADQPLTEEASPPAGVALLEGNGTLGPGAVQVFRYTTLCWTATRNVFRAWPGNAIMADRAALAAAPSGPTLDVAAIKSGAATIVSAAQAIESAVGG